jgi:hypothetical protein
MAHQVAQDRFAQMDMNRDMQRAQNITNAAQGASNSLMSAASALGQSSAGTANLGGGSNNGVPKEVVATNGNVRQFNELKNVADQQHYLDKISQTAGY